MNLDWVKYGLEEIKFLKSYNDICILFEQKLPFFKTKLFRSKHSLKRYPIALQLEPTNLCNLNCICCSRSRMKREKGFMEFALFKKIIDEGCEIGVKRIHLYLHGEPLLHPKIVDMIRFIKYKNLGISIATNGMVLNKELSSDILKTGVNSADYFTFSILGASKEIHEKIMKGVDHERVINNILNFIEMRKKMKKNGPIIEVIFYSMPENDGEEDLFRNIWKGYVDHVRLGGKISQQFAKYKNERNKILERKKTCNNLWERMTIFWDGRVTICIGDIDGDEIIGDLRKMKIDEVWNGENLLKIKMLHLEKKFRELNLCFNCDW